MVHGKTTNIIKKLRARLQKLLDEGVTPVFVFDGKAMPAKQSTNEGRTRERKQSMDTCLAWQSYVTTQKHLWQHGAHGNEYKG